MKERAKVKFDAATLVNYYSGSSLGNVYVVGDVHMRQTWPLAVKGGQKDLYASTPLLPTSFPTGSSETTYSIHSVMQSMAARNFSTTFMQTAAVPEFAPSPSLNNALHYFNATIVLRIPKQSVWFTPSVSENTKWAIIQYVAIFLIVYVILNRINTFVFRHQLLHAYSTADTVSEKLD